MNRFFKKLPLLAKLMLIGFIPFVFLIILTIQVYNYKTEKLTLFTNYKNYIAGSANINGLREALQEEGKFAFDHILTRGTRHQLVLQRPRTDALIQKIVNSNDPALHQFTSYSRLDELDVVRRRMDTFGMNSGAIVHYFSNTIFRLNTLTTIPPANTAHLQPVYKDIMVQKILSEMLTYLSIIRQNIYTVLYTKKYGPETIMGTIGAYDVYKSYGKELVAKASPETLTEYNTIKTTTALKPTSDYIDTLFKRYAFDSSFSAPEWWQASEEGMNELGKLQTRVWNRLNGNINAMYEREEQSRNRTLLLLIIALALVVTVIIYMVYIISRTLKDLKRATEKISNGETDVPVHVYSKDMVGSLAESIGKIDKNNKALAGAAIAISKGDFSVQVTPRSSKDELGNAIIQMQQALKQYSNKMELLVSQRTVELARSNEDLQQFAHVASHDMKEPLRKIATFSNMLSTEQKDKLSEKGKIYLDKIESAAKRMAQMIEGVLAYSTLSATEDESEVVDLNKILEEVENDLELAVIQKEARIKYSHLLPIMGMRLLVYQLFYNLINNALKFSKDGVSPIITITSKIVKKGDHPFLQQVNEPFVQIDITDNGIGFQQDYAEQMFGVFSRLNSKDKYEGTGLGLALCKKIVTRHGGIIWAEGTEDEGAIFHFLLPAASVSKEKGVKKMAL